MKEIVNNYKNLKDEDINRIVKRAKILLINDQDEILIVYSHNNYFLLGGHVEDNESDIVCLERELFEEAGMHIDISNMRKFFSIKHYNKDYPETGINSLAIANYYYLRTNVEPDLSNRNLTIDEMEGKFRIDKIHISKIMNIIEASLPTATRELVVQDTMKVIDEFIKEYVWKL